MGPRRCSCPHWWALAVLLLLGSPAGADEGPRPGPQLGPGDVVRIQLEALRENDAADRGVAICFRFASPSNRVNTGPLERFASMIKAGPYSLMLEYRDVTYDPVEILGDSARQRVTLASATRAVTYVFILSRQTEDDDCPGCWMTDAVLIERVEHRVT